MAGGAVVLTGTYNGGRTALAFALKRRDEINGMLVLSPYRQRERNENVESLKGLKALVLHDTSGECLTNSVVEVEEIASRAGFQRVPVHQGGVGEVGRCGAKSGQWLAPADSDLASVVGRWIDGRQLPDHLGADEPVMTATERAIFLAVKSGRMEVTVYTPHGKRPFPLLVFNHGDMDVENPSVRYGQRFRESAVSTVFLGRGQRCPSSLKNCRGGQRLM